MIAQVSAQFSAQSTPKVPNSLHTHTTPFRGGVCALCICATCARGLRPTPEDLAKRYLEGATLRALGLEIGRSHTAVRYQLRKVKGYRAMVTRMLLKRLTDAEKAYAVTRTREKRRRLKHALAMLRQNRPAMFARLVARRGPPLPHAESFGGIYRSDCPQCASTRAVFAWRLAKAWRWTCSQCDAGGDLPARGTLPAHSAWTNASTRQQ